MTPDELAAIKSRAARATPGPWGTAWGAVADYCVQDSFGQNVVYIDSYDEHANLANADFIAAARSDIPALLAALEAATKLVQELRDGLMTMGDYCNESSWESLAQRRLPWEAPQSSGGVKRR